MANLQLRLAGRDAGSSVRINGVICQSHGMKTAVSQILPSRGKHSSQLHDKGVPPPVKLASSGHDVTRDRLSNRGKRLQSRF